jgi:hypothetical protein
MLSSFFWACGRGTFWLKRHSALLTRVAAWPRQLSVI